MPYIPLNDHSGLFYHLCYCLFYGGLGDHVDGSVQDCNISIANALDILQSYAKPAMQWINEYVHVV